MIGGRRTRLKKKWSS
ncbi:hypothetical protein Patl1_19628 [Pistacia atlantica]|uniref:Uncharacterized protein n=1 Tax=Pistacia atlantica TaxID=434234 RepID=A0ACC1C2H9_9ROSI|nr:hypothetical protein Patl1_19628 [Pistacia atlantica]